MADPVAVALAERRRVDALARRALRAAFAGWQQLAADDLDGSWSAFLEIALPSLVAAQKDAAAVAGAYLEQAARAVDASPAASGTLMPDAFAGAASDGRPLDTLLLLTRIDVKERIGAGQPTDLALAGGWARLQRIVATQVFDAGRVASGVALTATKSLSGYVRQISPPACARCVVLAGKFFRWNTGFARHPHCDCVHIPTRENRAGHLTTDPDAYFKRLSAAEQERIFTKAGAQAIRDGADIGQVVNARRGMETAQVFGRELQITREGITRRGRAGQRLIESQGRSRIRLMPESIYRIADGDRDEAIRLLTRFGFIT